MLSKEKKIVILMLVIDTETYSSDPYWDDINLSYCWVGIQIEIKIIKLIHYWIVIVLRFIQKQSQ